MEGGNGLPNLKNSMYTAQNTPVSPFSLLANSTSYPNSLPAEPKPNLKPPDGVSYHQRCSSESFLLEEQPSWLDDLLDDSDTSFFNRGHRRSASDSYAYLCEATETFAIRDQETKNRLQFKHGEIASMESKKVDEVSEEVGTTIAVEQRREENSSKSPEGSADRAGGSQAKPSSSKTEAKRAKQHNAHRSRVRKLQYIAHLERTVQNLQTEGSEISGELEFLEQQNIILVMENRALRQRLETISQEQLIKHWEQEMLEREIARLQTLHHLQKQQQQQQESQHQHPKQRLNKSRDHIDQTTNGFQMNNKEASSSKGSANGSVRI